MFFYVVENKKYFLNIELHVSLFIPSLSKQHRYSDKLEEVESSQGLMSTRVQ